MGMATFNCMKLALVILIARWAGASKCLMQSPRKQTPCSHPVAIHDLSSSQLPDVVPNCHLDLQLRNFFYYLSVITYII